MTKDNIVFKGCQREEVRCELLQRPEDDYPFAAAMSNGRFP